MKDILLFSNPSPAKDMTIRMSRDEGRNWGSLRAGLSKDCPGIPTSQ